MIGLYSLVGFVVVPWVAKRVIVKQVQQRFGCTARIETLRFNPYTFNVTLRDFHLLDRRGEVLATGGAVFVNFAPLPLVKRVVALEEVRLAGLTLATRLREDRKPNLLDLVPLAPPGAAPPPKSAKPVVVRIDRLAASALTLTWDDATTRPPATAAIDSLALVLTGFVAVPGDTTRVETSFAWRAGGGARVAGTILPLDGIVDARIDVDSLDLTPANPYLARFAYLDLRSGKLDLHTDVHAVAKPKTPPVANVRGDLVLRGLQLYDTLKDQDFFGFERLAILHAEASSMPAAARVDEIGIDHIYARLAIAADASFNVTDVLAPGIALAESTKAARTGSAAGVVPSPSAAADSSGGTSPGASPPAVAAAKAPAAGTAAKPPLPDIAIGRIRIDGGEVDFSDLSLPLPFAARVHSVQGEVTAIAPDNAAGSKLLVEGTVGEHGYAKASGFVNVFDPKTFTDIAVDFKNVELTPMTPYSGKFMGYRIKQGKLSLGLDYDIKQAQLQGDHKIFLEKLNLGDKIDSPDAVGLPIKLAIALLKDKNGNIDLDVEVAGDLNDPKVNTWSLVWQAFKKVILKIAMAPFRFLGGLLGIGGDELEFVEFEAGRTNLTPPQHERLGNLAKGLTERPTLLLQVRGAFDTVADAYALQEQHFEAELMGRLLAVANGDSAAARTMIDDPSSGPMQTTLETLCTETLGADSLAALRLRHTKPPPEGGAPRLDAAPYFQEMRQRLIDRQTIGEPELLQLADQRASVICAYLATQAIAPERLQILEREKHNEEKGDWVRCRLALEGAD